MKGKAGSLCGGGQAEESVESPGEGPGVDQEDHDQEGFAGEGVCQGGGKPPGGGGQKDQDEAAFEEDGTGCPTPRAAAFGGLARLSGLEPGVEEKRPEHGDTGANG